MKAFDEVRHDKKPTLSSYIYFYFSYHDYTAFWGFALLEKKIFSGLNHNHGMVKLKVVYIEDILAF